MDPWTARVPDDDPDAGLTLPLALEVDGEARLLPDWTAAEALKGLEQARRELRAEGLGPPFRTRDVNFLAALGWLEALIRAAPAAAPMREVLASAGVDVTQWDDP